MWYIFKHAHTYVHFLTHLQFTGQRSSQEQKTHPTLDSICLARNRQSTITTTTQIVFGLVNGVVFIIFADKKQQELVNR